MGHKRAADGCDLNGSHFRRAAQTPPESRPDEQHIDTAVCLSAFYSAAHVPIPVSGDTGLFVTSPVQQYSQNYANGYIDHKFADKDTFDFVWFF